MKDLSNFYIDWKPSATEELCFKTLLDPESRKNAGMFCIVIGDDGDDWFYSDEEGWLEL